mmetsp:Transcript_19780/g.29365  ORF Transcript_19780/g.29365 Transcript_19780/m.29365 type:complete len:229 (-) Transcript_19780:160-846(-)|eukprot:CAMPEP_0194216958 /NCGR_PEP_ID=MMETSP0156-20130528/20074_1 /TAXON_ID=33649 /ORGANISM="Thalassionema nitzschioides, Strain L26-B" /LENGTH=228 /DNA_ID=CAMNT_0038945851 /DNA_START=71 /DNA_END=757 /DNA_ORIENTATION=+
MKFIFLSLIYLAFPIVGLASNVKHLTSDNYTDLSRGKTVFLMFYAPWCGHSKKMAPEWTKLASDWEGNEVGLVAKIDCTDKKSKPLCKKYKVHNFPSIHYGDPLSLEIYEGGRSYEDLSFFAKEILKPMCTPSKLERCDDDTKRLTQELMSTSDEELKNLLLDEKKKLKDIAKDFKLESKKLQDRYQQLSAEKDSKIQEVRYWGLELAKYVKAYRSKMTTETVPKDEL